MQMTRLVQKLATINTTIKVHASFIVSNRGRHSSLAGQSHGVCLFEFETRDSVPGFVVFPVSLLGLENWLSQLFNKHHKPLLSFTITWNRDMFLGLVVTEMFPEHHTQTMPS
jgi:hypothetical protein